MATTGAEANRKTEIPGLRILQGARERVSSESDEAQCQFEAHDSHASHSSSDPDLNGYHFGKKDTTAASAFTAEPNFHGGKILERVRVRVRDENARASSSRGDEHSSHSEHTDFNAHAQYAEE